MVESRNIAKKRQAKDIIKEGIENAPHIKLPRLHGKVPKKKKIKQSKNNEHIPGQYVLLPAAEVSELAVVTHESPHKKSNDESDEPKEIHQNEDDLFADQTIEEEASDQLKKNQSYRERKIEKFNDESDEESSEMENDKEGGN